MDKLKIYVLVYDGTKKDGKDAGSSEEGLKRARGYLRAYKKLNEEEVWRSRSSTVNAAESDGVTRAGRVKVEPNDPASLEVDLKSLPVLTDFSGG